MKDIATGVGAVALFAVCCVGLPLLFTLGLSVALTAWIGGAVAGAIALALAIALLTVRVRRRRASLRRFGTEAVEPRARRARAARRRARQSSA